MKKLLLAAAFALAASTASAQITGYWSELPDQWGEIIEPEAQSMVTSFTLHMMPAITCTGIDEALVGDVEITCSWTNPTDDYTLIGDGSQFVSKAIPNCTDTGGNHLNYTASTNALSCGTSGDGAGGGAVATDVIWDAKGDLAGGTGANTAAVLTVGTNDYILMAESGETTGLKWNAAGTTTEIADATGGAESAGTSDTYARGDHVHHIVLPGATYTKEVTLRPENAMFLATNFPQYVSFAGTNFPVNSLKYDTTTEEAAFWQLTADGYSTGNITFTVYWYADTSTTAAATVEWEVSITAITGDSDTTNVETDTLATSNVQSDTLGTTDAQKLQLTAVVVSNLDSIAAGDLVFVRISRNVGGTDDMAGDAQMVLVKVSYTAAF